MAINRLELPAYAAPQQADFSSLAQLPQVYRQAQARQTLSNLQRLPDGSIDTAPLYASGDMSLANLGKEIDRNKALDSRDSRDFQFRQQEAQRAQQNADRSYGLQERSLARKETSVEDVVEQRRQAAERAGFTKDKPGYDSYILTGKMPREDMQPLTAGDKKAIMSAEDELPNIEGTIGALNTAKELNSKTLTGVTAGARAFLGSSVPGGGYLVDKGAADATTEWQKIMGQESIKTMADSLKGATTDFELNTFVKLLGDPATPPPIRERVINRMLQLAERKKQIAERRINDMRGGTYYKPGGNAGPPRTTGPTSETREIPQAAIEALRADKNRKAEFEAKYGAGTAEAVLR